MFDIEHFQIMHTLNSIFPPQPLDTYSSYKPLKSICIPGVYAPAHHQTKPTESRFNSAWPRTLVNIACTHIRLGDGVEQQFLRLISLYIGEYSKGIFSVKLTK